VSLTPHTHVIYPDTSMSSKLTNVSRAGRSTLVVHPYQR